MRAASVLFLVFLAVIFMTSSGAFAHEGHIHEETVQNLAQAGDTEAIMLAEEEATTSSQVAYALPFPGILPTHPLYFLKNIRDQLLDVLIQDPIRRIEYLTLMADKRYAMGEALSVRDEAEEAVRIMEEGESYYGRIFDLIQDDATNVGSEQLQIVVLSGKKHIEVLDQIKNKDLEEYTERLDKLSADVTENVRKIEEVHK